MTNQTPSFGINDLRIMLNLITVVASRGAIKPNEMAAVGELHDKLSNFLATADAAAKKAEQAYGDTANGDTAKEENING